MTSLQIRSEIQETLGSEKIKFKTIQQMKQIITNNIKITVVQAYKVITNSKNNFNFLEVENSFGTHDIFVKTYEIPRSCDYCSEIITDKAITCKSKRN